MAAGSRTESVANVIRPQPDGPLLAEGRLEVADENGALIKRTEGTLWLCRCGRSRTKPFCDGSHKDAGFRDDATVAADYVIKRPQAGTPGTHLRLTLRRAGPVNCFGVMHIVGADGRDWQGDQANLCRCGQSANKPFCDGTHRATGFGTD
jgi:CDGSH-type Zn-finger protein